MTPMVDPEVAAQLMGPLGGAIGLGMLMGGGMMFVANRKVVEPYVQRAHSAEIAVLQAKVTAQEVRIAELEKFREQYMALLERHSKATLNP